MAANRARQAAGLKPSKKSITQKRRKEMVAKKA
jgi:hypothetical protein